MKSSNDYERITISIPASMAKDIEEIKRDYKITTKSEVFKLAFTKFLKEFRKNKIKKIAESMAEEYETNTQLTAFTLFDNEEFK